MRRQPEFRPHSAVPAASTAPITPHSSRHRPHYRPGGIGAQFGLEGFYIVKSILREVLDVKRVFMRDTISHCGVLLDNTNRKPICRLWFNSSKKKQLGLIDANKQETRHPIKDVNDIYGFADRLRKTALGYESTPAGGKQGELSAGQ